MLHPDVSVRDVLDHAPTWREVVCAAIDADVAADEPDVARRLQPFLDRPATELVDHLVHYARATGRDPLVARLHGVLPSRG